MNERLPEELVRNNLKIKDIINKKISGIILENLSENEIKNIVWSSEIEEFLAKISFEKREKFFIIFKKYNKYDLKKPINLLITISQMTPQKRTEYFKRVLNIKKKNK